MSGSNGTAAGAHSLHRVVIVGGGFGGLRVARDLRNARCDVTLIDRRNFHLFQPLLYQVATGGLSPANIATPIRAVLKRQANARVLLADVVDFDAEGRRVILADGEVPYDTLVVAAGSRNHYFNHPEWAERAPALKTIEDATAIRRRILLAFEAAERETDAERRQPWLTFVVVGGGPTGVEMAGQIGELASQTLKREFRAYKPREASVILLEGADRILATFPPDLSEHAVESLRQIGCEVRTGAIVTDVQPDCVLYRKGDQAECIAARTVIWAAGVQASPLGAKLAKATGATTDRMGRVMVEKDLTLPNHPEIFVIGDLAHYAHQTGKPLPGVAPVAMQQGGYVADAIEARLQGDAPQAFRYFDKGNLATIGRHAAVADLGWTHFGGYFAWLAWLFVHILYLVQFQNRVLVTVQWAWMYWTRNRSARLITGEDPLNPPLPDLTARGEAQVETTVRG